MTDKTKSKDVTPDENEIDQEPSTEEVKDTCEDIQEDDNKVVTQQPKKNKSAASTNKKGDEDEKGDDDDDDEKGDDGGEKSSLEKEGPSGEIEIDLENLMSEDGCISASAGVGSISRDYMDGAINAEYVGPNVGCTMSCAEFPNIVTDCTLELCSANYVFGLILCKLGLAFDTKLVWTDEGVEAEALGTGLDLSEGIAVGALGMKIGIVNKEKRDKKWTKKKLKWQKKKKGKKSKDEENEEENGGGDDAGEGGEEEGDGEESGSDGEESAGSD